LISARHLGLLKRGRLPRDRLALLGRRLRQPFTLASSCRTTSRKPRGISRRALDHAANDDASLPISSLVSTSIFRENRLRDDARDDVVERTDGAAQVARDTIETAMDAARGAAQSGACSSSTDSRSHTPSPIEHRDEHPAVADVRRARRVDGIRGQPVVELPLGGVPPVPAAAAASKP